MSKRELFSRNHVRASSFLLSFLRSRLGGLANSGGIFRVHLLEISFYQLRHRHFLPVFWKFQVFGGQVEWKSSPRLLKINLDFRSLRNHASHWGNRCPRGNKGLRGNNPHRNVAEAGTLVSTAVLHRWPCYLLCTSFAPDRSCRTDERRRSVVLTLCP